MLLMSDDATYRVDVGFPVNMARARSEARFGSSAVRSCHLPASKHTPWSFPPCHRNLPKARMRDNSIQYDGLYLLLPNSLRIFIFPTSYPSLACFLFQQTIQTLSLAHVSQWIDNTQTTRSTTTADHGLIIPLRQPLLYLQCTARRCLRGRSPLLLRRRGGLR